MTSSSLVILSSILSLSLSSFSTQAGVGKNNLSFSFFTTGYQKFIPLACGRLKGLMSASSTDGPSGQRMLFMEYRPEFPLPTKS